MKRELFRFFVMIFAVAGMLSQAEAQIKVLEGNSISFGKIYQTGEMVHKTITLKNVGQDTIKINSVSTSCGCTAALLSDSTLAPGEESKVEIQFNPVGYMAEVTKYIYITDSSPKNRFISVKMTGYIAYALQPTPSYVVFNNARAGTVDSANVTLSNTSGDTIRITKVELPTEELTYKLQKNVLRPGEFTDLDVYLSPKATGSIDGYIRIVTTSKLQPVVQMRVYAGIIGR